MLERVYGLSPKVRLIRSAGISELTCSYPLQRVVLNTAAFQVLSALDGVTPLHGLVEPVERSLVDWLESLVTLGCLRVRYQVSPHRAPPTVEAIVPVLDNTSGLKRCFEALATVEYPRDRWSVTAVDDGSAASIEAEVGPLAQDLSDRLPLVRWLRLESNQGPAGARNAALCLESGPQSELVAFLDSDCVPSPHWLKDLTGVLESPEIAAVGGRVEGLSRGNWLGRYEDRCASLNMGPIGGPAGGPRDRIPYLATCNLVARRTALKAVGGFTPGLYLGEDVDLIWRMRDRGLRAFYLPAGTVQHAYRDQLAGFLSRKAAYAGSEAWLRLAHPGHFGSGTNARGQRKGEVLPTSIGPNYATDAALALVACGIHFGSGVAGLGAGALLLAGETIGHASARRGTLRAAGGAVPALGALARRMSAHVLTRCRSIVRNQAILSMPILLLCWETPLLSAEAAAVWMAAAGGEYLARQPALAAPVFLYGYTLDTLAYSFGRWRARLSTWADSLHRRMET